MQILVKKNKLKKPFPIQMRKIEIAVQTRANKACQKFFEKQLKAKGYPVHL